MYDQSQQGRRMAELQAHLADERWTSLTHRRDRNEECRRDRELAKNGEENEPSS